MKRLPVALLFAALAANVQAQQQLVLPPAANGSEGNSSTSYPWSRANSAIRIQYVYDSSAFTTQGVAAPILISAIKFRGNANASYAGGSYAGVSVSLSTAVTDHLAPDLTFDNNHGPDRTWLVNQGTVTLLPITSPTSPNGYFVDLPLAAPFFYDPAAGDLLIDVQIPAGMYSGTGAGVTDYSTGAGTPASRLYNLTDANATTATGTNLEAGVVLGIDYSLLPNAATATPYGAACVDGYATFHEEFAATTFDLAGSTGVTNSIRMTPNGSGYDVTTGSNTWFTPSSPDLGLGDDAVANALALGFSFAHPGGSTTEVSLCSNGFVWLDGTTASTDFSPSIGELVSQAARIACLWQDMNPTSAGTIHFDLDPAGGAAYCTWLGVQEYGQPTSLNHLQCALYANGAFELRWQVATNLTHTAIVGYSPGGGARQPASMDLSAALPFSTLGDLLPLALRATSRPVLGGTQDLRIEGIPAGSTVGVLILGFGAHLPPIDLGGIGMPGCFQHVTADADVWFVPSGSSEPFALPVPGDISVAGLHVYAQGAVHAPGVNPLAVTASNGIDLLLDLN